MKSAWQPIFLTTLLATLVPGAVPVWDLAKLPPDSQAVYFYNMQGGQRGVPLDPGDFNGDGYRDVVSSPFSANTLGRTGNGTLVVYFGNGTIGGAVDTQTYAGPQLVIHGAVNWTLLGVDLKAADIDKDGYTDIVLGSSHGTHSSTAFAAGEVVILFGRPEWGGTVREMDMAALPASQRVRYILGQRPSDRLGSWIEIHDIDSNGKMDLLMGMDLSDGPAANRFDAGAAVIAWDVMDIHPELPYLQVGGNGADGMTVIWGRDADDLFGATNYIADLDGNGQNDVIVSAGVTRSGLQIGALSYPGAGGGDGPANDRPQAGEVAIFWDAPALKSVRSLDLRAPGAQPLTMLYGETDGDYFGEELYTADVTGDGVQDLLVGAILAGNRVPAGGAAYLFPDGRLLRQKASIDMAAPEPGSVVIFDGTESSAWIGDTIDAVDINGDGAAELFLALPNATPPGRSRAGYTNVIFGGQAFPTYPTRIPVGRVTTPQLLSVLVDGADANDLLAYSTSTGDIDGDGTKDYLCNAMAGDGYLNGRTNAGEYYTVSGRQLARLAAAPTNVRTGTTALAEWDAAQPIFGAVVGYEVTYTRQADPTVHVATLTRTQLFASDVPGFATIVSVRTVMLRGGTETRSLEAAIGLTQAPEAWFLY